MPWLFATARRHIANRDRGTRRRQALSDRLITVHAFGEAQQPDAETSEIDEALVDAIRRLPAGEREALMLVPRGMDSIPRGLPSPPDAPDPRYACDSTALVHARRRELTSTSETVPRTPLPKERLEKAR